VSFDQAAYPGFNVTTLTGAAGDPNLLAMVNTINKLQPQGATSIGNGIALGRATLNTVNTFAKNVMVVFTDRLENTPHFIADVAGSLNAQPFAIGLGTAQQVSTGVLDAIMSHTGGYMLLSGPLSPSNDDLFHLRKYFLQVLVGISNTSIITDPTGTIFPGQKVCIPFQLWCTSPSHCYFCAGAKSAERFFFCNPNPKTQALPTIMPRRKFKRHF
jgi:hypothetical protein